MSKDINIRLAELYSANADGLKANTSEIINEGRDEAMAEFVRYGLPTNRDESYKYSNISSWLDEALTDKCNLITNCDGNRIEIEQSSVGIVMCDINTFASEYSDIFRKYYTSSIGEDSLVMLSKAFASGGRVIYVPKGVISDKLFSIHINSCENEFQPGIRDIFIFEKDSLAKIHIVHNNKGVVNRVCEVFVASGANVEIAEEYYGTEESVVINTLSVSQKKNSFYKHISTNFSSGKSRCNEYVALDGQHAETSIYGAVSTKNRAHTDNTTVVKHLVENCRSYENFKCIADDKSTAVFSGNVFVATGADGTEAYQQNNNILLNNTANIYSKPNLEIYADDVKCSHGATVGQLDETALFYMRQRGIFMEDARKILLRGFLKDVIDKISDRELVDRIAAKLEENI